MAHERARRRGGFLPQCRLFAGLLLLASGHQPTGEAPCPDDAPEEASSFWKAYFDGECRVEEGDVPSDLDEDLRRSTASLLVPGDEGFSAERTTCRVSTVTEGGVLLFDVAPQAAGAAEEAWLPLAGTARREVIVRGREVAAPPCGVLAGAPRYEEVGDKVDQVMAQIREDVAAACGASLGPYDVAVHQDQGSTLKAKRTMIEADGVEGFTFDLKLAATEMEPVSFQVFVSDSSIGDSDESRARHELLEREREEERIRRDSSSPADPKPVLTASLLQRAAAHGQTRADFALMDDGDVPGPEKTEAAERAAEKLAAERALARDEAAGEAARGAGAPGPGGAPSPGARLRAEEPGPRVPVYGNWTVLDDLTSPPLCCLCNAGCSPACRGGEKGAARAPALPQEGAREQVGPGLEPVRVPTAGHGSPESAQPPSRGGRGHGDAARGRGYRRRSGSGFGTGDTFHIDVMPRRSAEDHAEIWARSRALVQQARAEGLQVPEAWSFYDDDERARCWQPPHNQEKCGSCWAFASLGALEKQICMRSHGTFSPSLSREHLVRCSEQNTACLGGNADKAYEDLMEIGGVLGTDCIPYQGKGSKSCPTFAYSWFGQGNKAKGFSRIDQELTKSCVDLQRYSNRPPLGKEWDMPFRVTYEQRWGSQPNMNDTLVARYYRNFAKSRSRERVPSWWLYGEEAMKTALLKYGAIYVSYRVRTDFKDRMCDDGCWPPGTVYGEEAEFFESACGCPSGHAVTLIGYGTDVQETGTRVPYWLLENSWGTAVHGNVLGEDYGGIKGWGKDPFTEDHPMKAEDQCVLAGWATSTLPRSGGCAGDASVNIREEVMVKEGPPDGFFLGVSMDGVMKLNVSVAQDSSKRFMATFPVPPGAHNISFMVFAGQHPKQQAFPVEEYFLRATSLRCRGTGYSYSFTKNDTKASLSWGRKTRQELEAAANQVLRDHGVDPDAKFAQCAAPCRTGRYSLQQPCLGLLMSWGSCYTSSYVFGSSWYQQNKLADCRNCTEADIHNQNLALATQNLPSDAFAKWHGLVTEALTAPDDPGWMRKKRGSCLLSMRGFVTNAQLTASYAINKPYGADGNGACDERHSAPWAPGHFVNAGGFMPDGSDARVRCPMPLAGEVSLRCEKAVLTATSHTCHDRAPALALGNREARHFHQPCADKAEAACLAPSCVWTGSSCARSSLGYFKIVRGYNYHGIEEGAAFAIAEMDRFVGHCPTTGWSRWSACSAARVCETGKQSRTRSPAPGYHASDPVCRDLLLFEERSCVKPGFCPQVLMRFAAGAGADVDHYNAAYKAGSTVLPYARAGATMMHTAYPNATEAAYWCNMITGSAKCGLYLEGHFQVKKDGDYFFRYEARGGGGEVHFNALGPGKELEPQFKISAGGQMYVWQDTGFHHRRRRTTVKPWVRASSLPLRRGTYFARVTRTGWDDPSYQLRLERMSAVYAPPLLYGGDADGSGPDALGRSRQQQVSWSNMWGAVNSHYLTYRELGYHGFPPQTELGAATEMLLRNEYGNTLVKRLPVTKLNFTAAELYAMFGVDPTNPPFGQYHRQELVIRSTVVLPDAGTYKFKYQQDTSCDENNTAWRMSSRRRHSKVVIRVAGGAQHAQLDRFTGSAELEVSHVAAAPGTTTFEVSALMHYDGVDSKATLPNFLAVEVKLEDMLHGATLELGTKTRYISNIDTLAGDGKVRIDWPDRDDPLSSALRASTFDGVEPQALLIGTPRLSGFAALAEGKIDAGACLTLEARVQGQEHLAFRGLALELCDEDGSKHYLALKSFSREPGSNATTAKTLGWVYCQLTHPTHLRMVRSPTNLTHFELGYKPDDGEAMATPFHPDVLARELDGFAGEMEVGVSMNTPEAYRYAEFYNVSVEPCPDACTDASGAQLFCGEVRTACGTTLSCPGSCAGGICQDGKCFDCPAMDPTATASWQCGTVTQVCRGRGADRLDVQVDRTVGGPAPNAAYFCDAATHNWTCHGTSKWGFLARGMHCGSAVDECGTTVKLFDCPHVNDVCVGHQCVCQPNAFPDSWDCDWRGDGCGRNVTFGPQDGLCGPGAVCHQHVCCHPKGTADFNSSWECGSAPDACGGTVHFRRAPGAPYLLQPATASYVDYMTGWVGTKIQAVEDVQIDRLAAGLVKSGSAWERLQREVAVAIWSADGARRLASVAVSGASQHGEGYAWEPLPEPYTVPKGAEVMVLMQVFRGDNFSGAYTYGSALDGMMDTSLARYVGGVRAYSQPPTMHYTYSGYSVGTVNFGVVANDGCGKGRFECKAHVCVKPPFLGFEVASGPCKATDDGRCVESANYPGNYGNSESCDILAPEEPFSAKYFDTEYSYDYLTIDGMRYQGRRRRYDLDSSSHRLVGPSSVSTSAPIKWRSDGSVTRQGFRLCVDSMDSVSLAGTGEETAAGAEEAKDAEDAEEAEDSGGKADGEAEEEAEVGASGPAGERRSFAGRKEAERWLREEEERALAEAEAQPEQPEAPAEEAEATEPGAPAA